MLHDECRKKVDVACTVDPYKSSAKCASWREEGWYGEGEGPCLSDDDCWPSLSCCGQRAGGRYCEAKSDCLAKQALEASGKIPTWVYIASGGAAILLVAAAIS